MYISNQWALEVGTASTPLAVHQPPVVDSYTFNKLIGTGPTSTPTDFDSVCRKDVEEWGVGEREEGDVR